MQDPISIANYFIKKSWEQGTDLTPMKLVKLVYLAHGWYLGITESPLLTEAPQAWKYGPVVPSVYHAFKSYGNGQVTKLHSITTDSGRITLGVDDDATKILLNKVWDIYSNYNGPQLSTLTHQKNTPWDIVWNQQGGCDKQGAIIPNEIIAAHYKKVIDGLKRNQAQSTI